jgi:hypothetical protein
MTKQIWRYLFNPFDNLTKDSLKLMNVLAKDHKDKLETAALLDRRIVPLLNTFVPKYQAFADVLVRATGISNMYQGHTQQVEALFNELTTTHIRDWDISIQSVYHDRTMEYKTLLPNYRSPFQTGGYETRIREVKALASNLANYPNLSHLQLSVQTFGDALEAARSRQQGYEGASVQLSKQAESLRVELAVEMHAVFGGLLQIFAANPVEIERFYEMELLRTHTATKEENAADAEINPINNNEN